MILVLLLLLALLLTGHRAYWSPIDAYWFPKRGLFAHHERWVFGGKPGDCGHVSLVLGVQGFSHYYWAVGTLMWFKRDGKRGWKLEGARGRNYAQDPETPEATHLEWCDRVNFPASGLPCDCGVEGP